MVRVERRVLSKALHLGHEEKSFVNWMKENNMLFTGEEYQYRLGIWLTNKRLVQEHNKKGGFRLAMNKFAHFTPAEYKTLLGFKMDGQVQLSSEPAATPTNANVDWRNSGVVNTVKNQGSCGSCWAFSTCQAQETEWAIKHGTLYSLSEQNLVDCVTSCSGCNGGLMTSAYTYVINKQSGKFMLESNYPYKGTEGTCSFSSSKGVTQVTSYKTITQGSDSDLMAKCQSYGAICIAIDASHNSFQLYDSGIYDESSCSSSNLDHGVGLVGYGTSGSQNYYIIRNSWGTSWGESGYCRMLNNGKNRCGVATMACYPVVA